jgi:purine-binding chemotaxis protein CheW
VAPGRDADDAGALKLAPRAADDVVACPFYGQGPLMSSDSTMQLVVFSLGEEEYALPITHVQEIIRYTEPRGVASQTPWIKGVISLRGKIVPVYDLASRLGLDCSGVASRIVMVESGEQMAGVIVGDVEEVLTLTSHDLDEVPAAGAACIQAIAKVGDRLVVLLDPAGIFAPEPGAATASRTAVAATTGDALAKAA